MLRMLDSCSAKALCYFKQRGRCAVGRPRKRWQVVVDDDDDDEGGGGDELVCRCVLKVITFCTIQ
jgi:hypothetical protein